MGGRKGTALKRLFALPTLREISVLPDILIAQLIASSKSPEFLSRWPSEDDRRTNINRKASYRARIFLCGERDDLSAHGLPLYTLGAYGDLHTSKGECKESYHAPL